MKEDEEQGVVSQASMMHTLTEDVRQQLYGVLKRQGMIDKMKSEMRHRLVMELTTKRAMPRPVAPSDGTRSLSQRAADSLVADYLSRRQFEYTLSVFIPEAGLTGQKLLTSPELLDLMHVNPHSKFHRQLAQTLSAGADGFLWSFLRQLAERSASGSADSGVQTEGRPLIPLSERLSSIERQYDVMRSAESAAGQAVYEERLMAYQREMEARLRREHDAEVERFKAAELARMRMEERERLHADWEKKRREMEAQQRERLHGVVERERAAAEQWKRQQESWDREAHQRRQALLEEVDTVRHRETALRREQDALQRERRLMEEKRKMTDEELRQRESRLREKEAEFDSKLNDERSRVRLAEEKKFMDRWRELEVMEVRAKEEVRLAEAEKEIVRRMREEVAQRQALFDEMEVVDYPTVKQENAALRQEIENVKGRATELRQDYEKEREKLEALQRERSGPSKAELEARKEAQRAEETARQERAMADHSMQGMQKRLQEEITQHQQLLQRFEEQSLQLREMNQEVEDLRQQLRHTETALTNELYRRPRGGFTPRTGRTGDLSARSTARDLPSPEELLSGRTPRRLPEPVADLLGPLPLNLNTDAGDVDELVAETKWRLRTLDQETESLQTAYRSFQHRLSNPVYAGGIGGAAKPSERCGLLGGDLAEPLVPENPATNEWRATSGVADNWRQPMTATWSKSVPLDMGSVPEREERPSFMSPRVRFAQLDIPMRDMKTTDGRGSPRINGSVNGPTAAGDIPARGVEPHGHVSVTFEMPEEGERSERAEGLGNTSHDAGSTGEQLGPVASGPEAASTTAQSLDDTWRSAERVEEEWEERRRRRDAEKAQREQEEWEEQQRELARLRGDSAPVVAPVAAPAPEEEKEDGGIDPVMQRYMAMVQERRQQPAPAVPVESAPGDSEEETGGGVSEAELPSDRSKSSESFW